MFIPQQERLEEIVRTNDIIALEQLLHPNKRIQNKRQDFKAALMLSAHNLKHLMKIDSLRNDCIILNLEDGVSAEQKPMALRLCAYFLSKMPQSEKKLVVRVNAIEEGGLEEIAFLNAYKPDAIRIPKIRTLGEIVGVLEILDENIELHLSIETKEAWSNLKTFQHKGRVKAVYLGVLDLLADLGLDQSILLPDNPTLHYLLAEFLISARIISAHPVSFVYQEHQNMAQFQRWIELEKMMGFGAKGCISPLQAEKAMLHFERKDTELEKARYIIELFEKMREQGITGFADERYGFIDEPIYKGALTLLKKS